MAGILVSAQLFGLLPVRGVRSRSPLQLVFERRSVRVVWAAVLFVGVLLVELVSLRHMCLTLSADTFGVIGRARGQPLTSVAPGVAPSPLPP